MLEVSRAEAPLAPFLCLGQVTAPYSFSRRQLVRSTMLADYENLRPKHHGSGASAIFRFLIGSTVRHGVKDKPEHHAQLQQELRAHDDILELDTLDGRGVDTQCACAEKTIAWLMYATKRWTSAIFIAKTEDDAYVNIRTLELDLHALHASHPLQFRVMYGAFDVCAMPRTPREPAVNASKPAGLGAWSGCWLGRVEDLGGKRPPTWPFTRAQKMLAQCGIDERSVAGSSSRRGRDDPFPSMPVPFPTGQLLAASRTLLEEMLLHSAYAAAFIKDGFAENRRGRCIKAERTTSSWATLTCDCFVGHLMAQAGAERGFNVTIAHQTLTKSHSYSWRAGHSGWTSPSRLSIVVHNLKKGTLPGGPNLTLSGEWMHTHHVASRSHDPGPPPLLWDFDPRRAIASGTLLTPIHEERHRWYHQTCSGAYEHRGRLERLTRLVKGPRQGGEADRDYLGGRPTGWIGWGCHPARGHPYPKWPPARSTTASMAYEKGLPEAGLEASRATRDRTLTWDWSPPR